MSNAFGSRLSLFWRLRQIQKGMKTDVYHRLQSQVSPNYKMSLQGLQKLSVNVCDSTLPISLASLNTYPDFGPDF